MTFAAGVGLVALVETLSTTIESGVSTSGSVELALTTAGTAMPTMVSMSILVVVGDGAGESVDPDPVVPTIGAN
jgi:hypothetical protein